MKKKILFLTHESALSGAPRSLTYFIQWIKDSQSDIEVTTLSLKDTLDSPSQFEVLSDKYYDFSSFSKNPTYSFIARIKRKLFSIPILSAQEKLIHQLSLAGYDLIYANTVSTLELGIRLKKNFKCVPLLLHVHEMRTAIEQLSANFKEQSKEVDGFIAASELVKSHLVTFFDVPAKNITRVYECSDVPENLTKSNGLTNHGITKVIMVGAAYWAKGDDLFILVANEVVKRDNSFHFYWLGSQSKERETVNRADIEKLDLEKNVHFLSYTPDPLKVVSDMDIFALTSRSDSFPLAAIEAGLLGLPIVCFDKASGITEIIEKGGGNVVSYLSIEEMADAIIHLKNNEATYHLYSEQVKQLFKSCKPDVISEELFNVCFQYI